ncbi:hypothetical protein MKW98_003656 [Papaver atlanticum]|uniref:Uncharacterized protein n=1 Tax=Papaver atlanticum TaxID=357466 RepID=A0AAD4SHI5_9MAGN|nr:hypothetical protein MKW98_003656 [Papaver atlanticum]
MGAYNIANILRFAVLSVQIRLDVWVTRPSRFSMMPSLNMRASLSLLVMASSIMKGKCGEVRIKCWSRQALQMIFQQMRLAVAIMETELDEWT